MTIEEAKTLRFREKVIYNPEHRDYFSGKRFYINGEVKLWKRDPNRISIPIKHGLYGPYGYITESNVQDFEREEK